MTRKLYKALCICFMVMVLFAVTPTNLPAAEEDRFPSKPIKLVIHSSPGSSSDLSLRALSKAAEKILGQPIMCHNLPGAGGARALSTVVNEKPDGYTLGIITPGPLMQGHVEKYDFSFVDDITPILQVQVNPLPIAVGKDAPWNTWQDFIKYAKEHKGPVGIGVFGPMGTAQLALKRIERIEKTNFTLVPFRGGGEVMAALLGGHIMANALPSAMLYARNGECKLLLFVGDKGLKEFPNVPTTSELYGRVGISGSFTGIAAPKGLPESILTKLHDAFKKSMEDSEFLNVTEKFNIVVSYKSPKELAEFIKKADEEIKELIKEFK